MDKVKFLQWNCQSIIKKKQELEHRAQDFDIVALSETWLNEEDKFKIRNFNTIRWNRQNRRGGGVAILVKNNLKYQTIRNIYNANCKLEVCGIKLNFNSRSLSIISLYKPPQTQVDITEWSRLLSSFSGDVLIMGDFNARHTSWGNPHNCNEGIKLLSAVLKHNFHILNNGSPTRGQPFTNNSSAIDLSLTNCDRLLISSWKTIRDFWGSDHLPITIQLAGNVEYLKKLHRSSKIYKKSTDWNKVKTLFSTKIELFHQIINEPNLDSQCKYSSFFALIEECILEATPNCTNDYKHYNNNNKLNKNKPKTWWNEDCHRAARLRKAAYKKFQFITSRENYLKVKRLDAQAKRIFRTTKKKDFMEFCNSLNNQSNMKYVWQKIKAFNTSISSNESSNEYNPETQTNIIKQIDLLAPPWCSPKPPEFIMTEHLQPDFLFSSDELNSIIDMTNGKSSPGQDGIDYFCFKMFPLELRQLLLRLYNEILISGSFPNEWKQFSVFFIPKKDSNKFRPISLAQCSLKLMERLINNRLYWWIEKNKILPNSQFGFRQERSCIDNLAILNAEITNNWLMGQDTCAVFLDIQSAYDDVLWDILVKKLFSLNISQPFIQFIYNLISRREVSFEYGDIDEKRTVCKGLPQGCVLSPLLYNIYVKDIDTLITENGSSKIIQFADDICVYNTHRQMNTCVFNLENTIKETISWFNKVGLSISATKSQFCIFQQHPNRARKRSIKIGNESIEAKQTIKFLGLTFQDNLKWNTHIDNIVNKCLAPIKIISFLRSTWLGMDPKLLLNLYKSLIRSRIEYGSSIWSNIPAYLIEKLESIQNRCIRIAMGYRCSTPINIILAESKIPPLQMRFQFLCKVYITKVLSRTSHILTPILESISHILELPTTIYKNKPLLLSDCYEVCREMAHIVFSSDLPLSCNYHFNLHLSNINTSFEEGCTIQALNNGETSFRLIFPNLKDYNCFFTDGSKFPDSPFAGLSVIDTTSNQIYKFRTSDKTSIFSCEALAIKAALEIAQRKKYQNIRIFSDSMSVLRSIESNKNPKDKSNIIFDILKIARDIKTNGRNIELFWIPAHMGIIHNEKADKAAKEAVRSGIDSSTLIPAKDLTALWKSEMSENFKKWILDVGTYKGIHYTKHFLTNNKKPWFHDKNLNRKSTVSLNRLRSGHTSLNESLYKIKIVDSPICSCTNFIQSANHIIWQCSQFDKERKQLMETIREVIPTGPLHLDEILCDMNTEALFALAEFIKKISIMI